MRDIALLGMTVLTLSFVAANAHAAMVRIASPGNSDRSARGARPMSPNTRSRILSGMSGRGAERGVYVHSRPAGRGLPGPLPLSRVRWKEASR